MLNVSTCYPVRVEPLTGPGPVLQTGRQAKKHSGFRNFNNNDSLIVKTCLENVPVSWTSGTRCVLFSVHDLDRLADRVHRQGGYSFGEDSRCAGLVPVLTHSATNPRAHREMIKCSSNKNHLGRCVAQRVLTFISLSWHLKQQKFTSLLGLWAGRSLAETPPRLVW